MSDSESDQPLVASRPSDTTLTQALRDVVAGIFKSGKMEELTVKRVRLAAEKKLGIEEGFFKDDGDWKKRSDQIIKEEAEARDRGVEEPATEESKKSPKPSPKPTKTKRPGPGETSKSRKRQKTETPESDNEEKSEGEAEEVKKPARKQSKAPPQKPKTKPSSPKNEGGDSDSAGEKDAQFSKEPDAEQKDASESEMSVVLDEEPEPSKPPKSKGPSQKGKKAASTKSATPKTKDADIDPDQAEIKRLQGWLVKCGIRKVWSKELAPYEAPKAKIKHLREMLEDAGMKGRYSQEKARQIREERELRADLEMVQEGAKRWGTGSPEAEESDSGPRRRLNRGRKSLAFLDDEDEGEETD